MWMHGIMDCASGKIRVVKCKVCWLQHVQVIVYFCHNDNFVTPEVN